MKVKVSDYIASSMVNTGIKHVFMVPGGFAMHLNDSFAKNKELCCVINHHEQACAMAAEGYARINNKMAAVCTTVGPGATNAITGVLCAYQDSIPMFIVSGQCRLATMACKSGLNLRSRGIQECDICQLIKPITKYCKLITNVSEIRYCIEKALFLATNGRPGPCWIDVPMDIQGKYIDIDSLKSFDAKLEGYDTKYDIEDNVVDLIISKIYSSERPVVFAGNGIRLAGAHSDFVEFINKTRIPVVSGMSSVDAISTYNEMYIGRGGITGTRAGNFAMQNADLLLSLGSRLNYNQTGFETKQWARNAYKIINDIDNQEIKKDTINADLEVSCDVAVLLKKLNKRIKSTSFQPWLEKCKKWKDKYPIVTSEEQNCSKANIYNFFDILTQKLSVDNNIVVSVGQSRVVGSQVANIKEGQRFITNATTASMGYGLPALIGCCIAHGNKKTILVTGEGSIQMNLQELQTIIQNKLSVVIVVVNNGGYHTMKQTQKNYFNGNYIGIGPESNDLSFPDISKIAYAYGYNYYSVRKNNEIDVFVDRILQSDSPVLAEIFCDPTQITIPKVSSRKLDNGEMISSPLEDMAPFLPREELEKEMIIPTGFDRV